ncbi:DUF927 domain-containing protein [Neglectibacter timonensis]|uniref:DUF927 domain-containing protein n=1 Tax=Neglectibacter timonensis TaxID=1776382 RepID=A0ABT1S0D7_9FIRM|nr:DUF927 domain-containing protein [Neglectibacter timonensis]MCQ4840397.1 DUF927 domain-containing protein [Neglectibacter timonensis]MCQ4844341.1 DUF927 domain-containing protein [Neglectibacter timonensis]
MEFDYQKEDFSTPEPYEAVLSISNPFEREVATNQLAEYAKQVGIGASGFKRMLKTYLESKKQNERMVYVDQVTEFTGQKLELDAGEWQADDFGVSRRGKFGEEIACPHPILPVERLVNIDTGVEKLKLAFCKGDRRWREVVADKKLLASNNSILELANMGIAVTSENSRALVHYISDLENLNYDLIPERKSVSRLGYIESEGFSPYVDGLIFDGDANFRHIFESIRSAGKRREWLELALSLRQGNVMARIVLAASFASVLVKPCGSLPFFVHLWGGESGTGKTVALMLAASVWGNPEMGRYIQTFNSTVVGREKLAAFLNHLPLIVDELQLARDGRGKLNFDVYALAEGVGRTRGNKSGGVDQTPTWQNCILTSGETPITGASSGAGAVNRVIEIECRTAHRIIEDGHATAGVLRKNYGFAGREFVEKLYQEDNAQLAAELYKKHFRALSENDTTEKQAMAAAVILTADELATDWLFQDGNAVTVQEISGFLASRAAVSSGRRGYEYFCDWAAQNANRLRQDNEQGDVYGVISGAQVCIIRKVFNQVAEEAGFSPAALLSYLKEENLIETRGRAMTCSRRINGVRTECVCLRVDTGEITADDDLF